MGRVKQDWEDYLDRGFSSLNKNICSECIIDDYLEQYIKNNGVSGQCNYCSEFKTIFPIDDILELLVEGIHSEYAAPENGAGWDGEWLLPIIETEDLIRNYLKLDGSPACDDICDSILGEQWCSNEFYDSKDEEHMQYAWETFAKQLKHETRYVFFRR